MDTVESYEATAEIVLRPAPCADDPQTFKAQEVARNLDPLIERPQ